MLTSFFLEICYSAVLSHIYAILIEEEHPLILFLMEIIDCYFPFFCEVGYGG